MHAQQFWGGMARGLVQHRGVEQQRAVLGPQPYRATIDRLVALGRRALGVHETHLTWTKVVFGQGGEQADHRACEHLRKVPRGIGFDTEGQHRHLAVDGKMGVEGIGEQPHVAQRMAQTGAEGFTGEEQVFQEQAMERRQMLGQEQSHMRLAALFAGGFPERRLRGMREAASRESARRQANPHQHTVGVGSAGAQGIDYRAHQRHIVGQITHDSCCSSY